MASVPVLDAVPNTTDELVKRKRQRRMSTGGRVTNKSMVRNKVPGTLGTDPVPCKQSKSPKGCKLAQERRRYANVFCLFRILYQACTILGIFLRYAGR